MNSSQCMRRDWDERARKDAFYYIASWRKDWDEASFWRSGEEDYRRLVAPVLQRRSFSPRGRTMLELGCGTGRMTRIFARHFERVIAFDISAEMLSRAQALHAGNTRIEWKQGNGTDLGGVPEGSVDFAFSYLVLQHLPEESLVHSYVREILRVLSSGGVCLFQFNGSYKNNMNWTGRMAWTLIDTLWSMRLVRASRGMANVLRLDPEMAGKSWHGVYVEADRVAQTVRDNGGALLELTGAATPLAWCSAQKI